MNIIKLNAIPSTNDYLKHLAVVESLNDFTIVVAENQTQGKGQMGAVWKVEPFNNLTFSVLVGFGLISIADIFSVNIAMANAVHKVLLSFGIQNVTVKWPNDIMAGNKKIGGILIENNVRATGEIQSIIGVGINVSQTDFTDLPQASSILKASGILLDKELLLQKIVQVFEEVVLNLEAYKLDEWDYYHQNLFKKNTPITFETLDCIKFTGMIKNVNQLGQLGVIDELGNLNYYSLKQIKMLY